MIFVETNFRKSDLEQIASLSEKKVIFLSPLFCDFFPLRDFCFCDFFLQNGLFPASFPSFNFRLNITLHLTVNKCSLEKFADVLIRTADLWCRKQQQLSNNPCPKATTTARFCNARLCYLKSKSNIGEGGYL